MVDLVRCSGSHLKCSDLACLCPCHGRRQRPIPKPKPPRVAKGPSPHAAKNLRTGPKRQQNTLRDRMDEIILLRSQGMSAMKLAERYHVSPETIRRALRRAGADTSFVPPPHAGPPPDEVIELRRCGMTISDIARNYGVDRWVIYAALGRPRRVRPRTRKVTQ